jgi:hypothetical protein
LPTRSAATAASTFLVSTATFYWQTRRDADRRGLGSPGCAARHEWPSVSGDADGDRVRARDFGAVGRPCRLPRLRRRRLISRRDRELPEPRIVRRYSRDAVDRYGDLPPADGTVLGRANVSSAELDRLILNAAVNNAALETLLRRWLRWRSSRCRCGSSIGSARYGYPMDSSNAKDFIATPASGSPHYQSAIASCWAGLLGRSPVDSAAVSGTGRELNSHVRDDPCDRSVAQRYYSSGRARRTVAQGDVAAAGRRGAGVGLSPADRADGGRRLATSCADPADLAGPVRIRLCGTRSARSRCGGVELHQSRCGVLTSALMPVLRACRFSAIAVARRRPACGRRAAIRRRRHDQHPASPQPAMTFVSPDPTRAPNASQVSAPTSTAADHASSLCGPP